VHYCHWDCFAFAEFEGEFGTKVSDYPAGDYFRNQCLGRAAWTRVPGRNAAEGPVRVLAMVPAKVHGA
jgi:hypothetical protein